MVYKPTNGENLCFRSLSKVVTINSNSFFIVKQLIRMRKKKKKPQEDFDDDDRRRRRRFNTIDNAQAVTPKNFWWQKKDVDRNVTQSDSITTKCNLLDLIVLIPDCEIGVCWYFSALLESILFDFNITACILAGALFDLVKNRYRTNGRQSVNLYTRKKSSRTEIGILWHAFQAPWILFTIVNQLLTSIIKHFITPGSVSRGQKKESFAMCRIGIAPTSLVVSDSVSGNCSVVFMLVIMFNRVLTVIYNFGDIYHTWLDALENYQV